MAIKAYITPKVLEWARESAGYSIEGISEELSKKFRKVRPENIIAWEEGAEQPSYAQLKRLADIYKRPIAVFFFPEPPEEDTLRQKFRSLPESHVQGLPPTIRYIVRKALVRQMDLEEIHDGIAPDDIKNFRHKIKDVNIKSASILAEQIRDILAVSIDEQSSWKDSDAAFKFWRNKLEENGIWVFKDAFQDEDYCGFALHHETFPVIYINNSMHENRQIFTLSHELGHLLITDSGIDFSRNVEYEFDARYKDEEVFCNSFAGEFLVPPKSLPILTEFNDENIGRLSKKYKVSREVILRRYLDKGLCTSDFYDKKVEEWESQARKNKSKKKSKEGGGDYFAIQGVYLGEKYPAILFKNYYRHKIDEYRLSEYLDMKLQSLHKFEDYFLKNRR